MNLFVGNLNPETTVTNLRNLFSEFGEILSAKIIYDNATGMSRGFGFVEMADKFHAFDCIDNIDAIFFEGNVISVKEAKQNNMKPGSKPFKAKSGPRAGGFNSSRPGGSGPSRPVTAYNSLPRPVRPAAANSDNFNSTANNNTE
jgi:RNA recognition motif-containing protein